MTGVPPCAKYASPAMSGCDSGPRPPENPGPPAGKHVFMTERHRRLPPRLRARQPPFCRLVYRPVRRVPRGKVVTYGQVAAILGQPRGARAVGLALGALNGPLLDLVPWQRVINAAGRCSHRDRFWADIQRELLEGEGVRFDRHGRGV